jgi:hypothetical protein
MRLLEWEHIFRGTGKWPLDWPLHAGVPREVAVVAIRGTEQVVPRVELARICE